jgi:DeoR/GlpR family transcriptional regulator of sugar metabolism
LTVIERREKILQILKAQKKIDIKFLAKMIDVSEVTVRRDIRILEREGKLLRSRGVIILPDVSEYELSFMEREKENVDLKRKIAREAINFVKEGMVVGFDASTTALQIAKLVIEKGINITLVTTSLPIFRLVTYSNRANVILIGGEYDMKNLSFVGPITIRNLDMFCFNLCFIGASTIIPERGFFTPDSRGAEVIRHFALNSSKVIGVTDSSKFKKSAQYLSVDIKQIDVVITDDKFNGEYLKRFPSSVKVIMAK